MGNPVEADGPPLSATEWHLHIRRLMGTDDRAALRAAKAATRAFPRTAALYSLRALIQTSLGRLEDAEASLNGALKYDSRDPQTLTRLAHIQVVQGRFEEARRAIATALDAQPVAATTRSATGGLF